MKRVISLFVLIVLICTGCGSNITVTTEQNDLMAEYVSGVLLKYSFDNEWKYTKIRNAEKGISSSVSSSKISNTTEQTITNTTNNTSNTTNTINSTKSATTSSNTSTNNSLTTGSVTGSTEASTGSASVTNADPMATIVQGLNLNGATINYNKYIVASNYPEENLVLSVPAGSGQKVIAIEFSISNPTATPIVCNTSSNNLTMKLIVNKDSGNSEAVTMLKNDLINLNNVTINSNSSYTAVAIYLVPESKATSISSLELSIAVKGGNSANKKLL